MPPVTGNRNQAPPVPPAPPTPPAPPAPPAPPRIPLQERTNTLQTAKTTLNNVARAGQQENLPEHGALPDTHLINAAVEGIKTHFTDLGIEVKKVPNASNNQLSARLDGIVGTMDLVIDHVLELPRDIKDEFGASQDRLVDAITALSNKIDGLSGKIDGLSTRVDRLETKVDRLETKVNRLETKVNGISTRMDGLETRMDGLEEKITNNVRTIIKDEIKRDRKFVIALHRNSRSILRNQNLSTSNNFSPMFSLDETYGINKRIDGPKKPKDIDNMTIPACKRICQCFIDTPAPPHRASKSVLEQFWRNQVRHHYGYIDDDEKVWNDEEEEEEDEDEEGN